MKKLMTYNIFLFYNLYCLYDKEFANQVYDWQYDAIFKHYEEFRDSEFNDPDMNLYECIINYLHSKFN